MSKNKFIRALKIMCVLAPIVLPLIVGTISFISGSISVSGITTTTNTNTDNGAFEISQNLYLQAMPTIIGPLTIIFDIIGSSPIGQPIVDIANWTTTNIYGLPLATLVSDTGGALSILTFPLALTLIVFWYIIVELVFFIPEVIILFIRWCKNLMYSFTRKGGFDA